MVKANRMGRRSQLLSAAGLVSGLTAASRVLGVVRDALIAAKLGASSLNDVFQIAQSIPNLARRVLGEGALSAFIVPVVSDVRRKKGPAEAWRSTANALNLFAALTLVLTIVGCVFSKPLFVLYGGSKFELAEQVGLLDLGSSLTRIMFPYLMILTLVALLMGVLHSLNHFLAPALGSAVINIVMIAAAVIFFSLGATAFLYVQAWAIMLGVVLRLAILFPPLLRRGFRWQPVFDHREKGFVELTSKMPAAVYATAVAQINIAVSFNLATNYCGEGSVVFLRYSQQLIQLPLALFATALSTVLLPQLSAVVAEKNHDELRDTMGFAFRGILLVFIPATIGLMVLGYPIVEILFQRGKWTAAATAGTTSALLYYAIGLVALGAQRIFIPLYYAQKDMVTPVKHGAVAMVANIILSVILMQTPLTYSGLALAGSLAAILNTWLLWRGLTRRFGRDFAGPMWSTLLRSLACAAVMGLVCGAGFYLTRTMLHPTGTIVLFALTIWWIAVGLGVYAAASHVAGLWDRKLLALMLKQG
jgi:putative peptidoglycan lipid II flippase